MCPWPFVHIKFNLDCHPCLFLLVRTSLICQVPVCDLTKKVVALYFYEDGRSNDLTTKLKEAYDELVLKKKKNFEVVLVYISTSWQTWHTTDETFWKTFKTMPWLALPFKDPNVRKLQLIFNYPLELDLDCPDPSLVIIGRRGKFFEIYGADILMKFGCPAYPFTSVRAAELVARKVKKVRLDNFWGPNTVFNRKSGSEEGFIQVFVHFPITTTESLFLCSYTRALYWYKERVFVALACTFLCLLTYLFYPAN